MYKQKRLAKHKRVRKTVSGVVEQPRVSVFRSSQHIYVQLIDDMNNKTLLSESDLKIEKGTKRERAMLVGESLAKKAGGLKITKIVFDRGGFKYQGRVAAVAEGLRKGGLLF